ncbi:GlxA family transcriptional regulator [Mesorhizobium sp. B2-3-4]|uniref:GlxA family transcriptional regulator n=1 Tax=Mesorhizobium sp. B2-3-4 TaxID=2589959 RepID=UPI00112CD7EA|nr:GlxA family transcriptional regulator [Mesorhizobium sp. B2-3-4]TPM40732.1 GlxA family transcriptional regulator [Mesorhizobium sp. B2-3-4]
MALRVGILAMEGAQLLDVSGPLDVFAEANLQAGRQVYVISIVASKAGAINCSSGARLLPDAVIGQADMPRFHTLLAAGAPHLARWVRDEAVLEWLRAASAAVRRYGSVCTGAFLLAQAGLLNGRRATTHWAVADQLAERFPEVILDVDAIHVRDGRIRTAAGVTAGLDLALALVEEDLGTEIARRVAAQLVMYFRRGGGQLQYSRRGAGSPAGRSALQQVQRWVIANPADQHGVDRLAHRAGMSPRHFARLFRQEVGTTPSAWVEAIRVEAAQRLLETGTAPKLVAGQCGFCDIDTFRRAFQRKVGVTPAAYRRVHTGGTRIGS